MVTIFIFTFKRFLKETAKNSSWPVIGLGNKGPLKVLNDTKQILDDHGNTLDSFRVSWESFRSFRGPLLLKSVTGQELFFAVSYSKPALVIRLRRSNYKSRTWIVFFIFMKKWNNSLFPVCRRKLRRCIQANICPIVFSVVEKISLEP